MKLEEIAEVMIGVLAKREWDEKGENSYLLFSLKNHEENKPYEEIKTKKDLSDKQAKEGDLLFRLLYPNKIISVEKELVGKLIPSQFCIIRPKPEKIDSTILRWYLESKQVEAELGTRITGSIIKSMPISNLKTLEIPNISKEEQRNMKNLILLWEEEKRISEELIKEKEKLYNFYLEEMIKRGEENARRRGSK